MTSTHLFAQEASNASNHNGELGSLENPEAFHEPLVLNDAERFPLAEMLERMMLIRLAEEIIGENVTKGVVRCPCHLAIGQEAVAVGVAHAIKPGDRLFGAHRSHAHYLALGGALHGLLAEVLGRDTGVSRGMGGSMHLVDRAHGLYGTVPIVGATIPHAVGAGLAAKMDKRGALAVSFFGDGATEEGAFHESMNLAATMKLPVLFVCENNLFSSHLHVGLRQPQPSVSRYAEAHRIPWERVDGNDVVAMARVTNAAAIDMREGKGPRFIEAVTYRWRGHVGPREDEDVGVKRKDDLHLWKGRDPIRRLGDAMVAAGTMTPSRMTTLWDGARQVVAAAWSQAVNDPFPPPEALLDRVYASRTTDSRDDGEGQ